MKALLFALAASSVVAGGAMAATVQTQTLFQRGMELRRAQAQAGAAACAKLSLRTVAPDGVPLLKRLDQLPRAVLEHAVFRTVNGCGVREIVYQGKTYYVTSIPKLETGPDTVNPHAGLASKFRFGP